MNSDAKVPKNWKPNPEVRKSIEAIFEKEPHKKETIQSVIRKFRNKTGKDSDSNSASNESSTLISS